MKNIIKILLAEDNINDVKLLEKEFKRNSLSYELSVVDNEVDYRKSLITFCPDIILSDYSMPVFDGLNALRIRMEISPLIPFIIVTGSINETTAVECLKAGADDYVIKEHISRICPSIKSALRTHDLNVEKEAAQKALIESEYNYRTLVENLAVGVYQITPDGKILHVNPAFIKIMGYNNFSSEEINSQNSLSDYSAWDFYPDSETRNMFLQRLKESGEIKDMELQIYDLSNKLIWVNITAKSRFDKDGNLLWIDGVLEDISIRKAAEIHLIKAKEQAEEMSRLKSSFLANMSHEIRTPLNGILGFAEILKEEIKDNEQLRHVKVIEKSGRRLLETLDLILNFSKLEAESVNAHYGEVNIYKVIDEVVKNFEAMAKNKNLSFTREIKHDNITAQIDERFLRHVLNNLIKNAIVYTDNGGVIVTFDKDENDMIIKVKDTGIGIAKENFEIIFEPFRQESEGYSRNFEGTGLGLSITKRFIELLKGEITVQSEVGIGSTFTVRLPLNKDSKSINESLRKENQKKKVNKITTTKSDLSILIVEDDGDNMEYTASVLNKQFKTDAASNGQDAIEMAKNKVYDIIFMDINLGKGMDGIQTTKEIRKIKGYNNIPIVALTAYTREGDKEEFLAFGCTHYLGKPFSIEQLEKLVDDITEGK